MRALLIEPVSGISGDMFVAAAAALAGCEAEVAALPAVLGLSGVSCEFSDVARASIQCRRFEVREGLRPAEAVSAVHLPAAGGAGGHAHHHHAHRPLSTIRKMIEAAALEPAVKARALRMFQRLGEVEAAAHGIPIEEVHFHEVGAVDSIIDIVAAALCIERLDVGAAFCTPVCVGHGTVETAHGILPVPAPATERLLQGMPTEPGALSGEWTTPTGALILDELKVSFEVPALVTRASALGGGGRNPAKRPNVLRLRLGEVVGAAGEVPEGLEADEMVVIRCNIDDLSGELLGADFVEAALGAGARDVVILPAIMKKGRPGQVVEVLAETARVNALARFLLEHTTTIGVRMSPVRRLKLPRETVVLTTPFGEVAAKQVTLPDGRRRIMPEYADCRRLAAERGASVQDVYRAALGSTEDRIRSDDE